MKGSRYFLPIIACAVSLVMVVALFATITLMSGGVATAGAWASAQQGDTDDKEASFGENAWAEAKAETRTMRAQEDSDVCGAPPAKCYLYLPFLSCLANDCPIARDPAKEAPPLDMGVATNVSHATGFLYGGADPIQTGVAPGTIELTRTALLRGRVMTREGAALPDVTITVLDHSEFGQTHTRIDGMFDMVVNGGGPLTIQYEKASYLPAQREVDVPWQDYVWLPDVVLVALDPQVTAVVISSTNPMQIVRGSVVADSDGVRQATLLIPQGVQASMTLSNGMTQTLTSFHVRITEFTVGEKGPEAMPAELPPTVAYTYATEFTVDEAVAAGAVDVRFSQPLISYHENFLNFPVGTAIPLGYYDRVTGLWVPSANGRVVKVLGVSSGMATLDIDGSGQPATPAALAALGVSGAERTTLASLYAIGQSLWRTEITHFTPWDANMGVICDEPCLPPDPPAPQDPEVGSPCEEPGGSTIECQNQVLGEALDIVGTPYSLHYRSDRVPGRQERFSMNIPLSGSSVSSKLKKIRLEISVAGRSFAKEFPPTPDQAYTFIWDGKDAYNRTMQGRQSATVQLTYDYPMIYGVPAGFGGYSAATANVIGRATMLFPAQWQNEIGGWDARGQSLGGWMLSVHHAYDPVSRILYLGDGGQRKADIMGTVVNSLLYNGSPNGIAADPDGSVYFAVEGDNRVFRLDQNGRQVAVAGTGERGFGGDGGPATAAKLAGPTAIKLGADGSLYIIDRGNNRIRRVGPDGIITTVAGNGGTDYSPDGIPATQAQIDEPEAIAIGLDGSLYIAHLRAFNRSIQYIRRVGPDGVLTTAVGKIEPRPYVCSGEGGPAGQAEYGRAKDLDVGPDGSLYIAAGCDGDRVFRVTPDGTLRTAAGGGVCSGNHCGDGGQATSAKFWDVQGIDVTADGSFYVIDSSCIRRVGADGIITTVAGLCDAFGYSGDGELATRAKFHSPRHIALGPDGNLYVADTENYRIRRVSPALPGMAFGDFIPSADGSQVYVFSQFGRHLRTLHALTGAVLYQFGYDAEGRLVSVANGDGDVTTIERNDKGKATAILAPFGQRTALSLDANGYLAKVTDPIGAATALTYTQDGLLTVLVDPRGGVHEFAYDDLGRLIKDADPAGGSQTLARTIAGNNFTVTRRTALNRTTVYAVDNLPTRVQQRTNTFPDGTQSHSQIGVDGRRTMTLPDGMVTTFTEGPDARWGMQAPLVKSSNTRTPGQRAVALGTEQTVNLSDQANPLSLVNLTERLIVNGKAYTTVFDAGPRTFTAMTPQGRQSTAVIDAQGRLVREQVAGLLASTYSYDEHGRLIAATQGTGSEARTTTFAYDSQGYLRSITDPLNQTTQFGYDAAGRVLTQTLPGARTILYAYDANDNLTAITPPGRPAHTFTYTPVDLLAIYQPPQVDAGNSQTEYEYNKDRQPTLSTRPDGKVIELAYDGAGRLTALTTPRGLASYSYDPQSGQLSSITAPGSIILSYGYDGALPTTVRWSGPISGSVGYSYDNDFRLSALTINGGMTTAYQYDSDSLLTRAGDMILNRDPQNGLLKGSTLGNVTDAWTYNGFGEVTSYRSAYAGAELFKTEYAYDKLGRIITKTETFSGTVEVSGYSYDMASRLAEVRKDGVVVAGYTYDSNGNRLTYTSPDGTITATYDDQDRLLRYGDITYTYTANGELLSKTEGSETTLYDYDALGNLITVTLPDGTLIEYLIDGQNRRVGKKVNGTLVQGFLYGDQLNPIAELDGNGRVVARFIYGSTANVPDYMVKDGVTYRLIGDQVGSPRLVLDAETGVLLQRFKYEEFGEIDQSSGKWSLPFGFAGGIYDPATDLIRFGTRDYDAEVGRWTAKDHLRTSILSFQRQGTRQTNLRFPFLSSPADRMRGTSSRSTVNDLIGFDTGDSNLYAYVADDPVNWIDRYGLDGSESCQPSKARGLGRLSPGDLLQNAAWSALAGGFAGLLQGLEGGVPAGPTGAIVGGVVGFAGGVITGFLQQLIELAF